MKSLLFLGAVALALCLAVAPARAGHHRGRFVAFVGPFGPSYGTAVVVAAPVPQVILSACPGPTVPAPAITTPATLPVVPAATLSYVATLTPAVQLVFLQNTYGTVIGERLFHHHFGRR